MKRKVVKLGPATLVISLPSKWTKENNVQVGDEIEVQEQNKTLYIEATARKKTAKEITIEITEENEHDLKHILTHVYRLGYDKITVKGKNISDVKKMANALLMGFEITSRDNNECIIENITEPEDQKYATVLRRIFLTIKETQEFLKRSIQEGKFSKEENEELRNQVDKYVFFCRRIIYRQSNKEDILNWELLTFLMHIQHTHYYLYKYILEKGVKKDNALLPILKELQNYFDLFYQSYFSKDEKLIHKIQKMKDTYQFGKCLKLIDENKNHVIYSYIREIFRLIQLGTSPVLSLSLKDFQ